MNALVGPSTYRPDIDGLRALSVLAVVAFHLNGLVSGGYVGVDVFFVISGFLIATIVFRAIDAEAFSFLDFYDRRIRRIAPALILTLLLGFVASILLTGPSGTMDYSKSSLAALFFVPNIYFYATSGYFAPQAHEIPLLHLWSLGVEEQFYLLFPVTALLLSKRVPRALLPALVILGLLSLISSQVGLGRDPEASFYLLHNRAFELTLGILLARLNVSLRQTTAQLLSMCGAISLVAAILLFKSSTQFPGLAALLPCLGAALLIWSGQRNTFFATALSFRPLVYIGKISYPLYLAHWPIIVFGKIAFSALPDSVFALFVIVASICVAAFTYHFVEYPIRHGGPTIGKTAIVGAAALLTVLSAGFSISASGFASFYGPVPGNIANFKAPNLDDLYLEGTCFLKPEQSFGSFDLAKCLPQKRPEVILWGDSHAAHLFNGLKFEFEKAGYSLGMFAASLCPPLSDYRVDKRPYCKEVNDHVIDLLKTKKPDVVILSASWTDRTMSQLEPTLKRLSQDHLRIVVLGNTPIFLESVPAYLLRHLGKDPAADPIQMQDRSAVESAMHQLIVDEGIEGVSFLSLRNFACPAGDCPLTDRSGALLYWDGAHLTETGSRWIATPIVSEILSARSRQ